MLLFIHEIINHINDIINDIEQLCHKPFGLLVKYLSMIYLNNIFISDHFQSIFPHHNVTVLTSTVCLYIWPSLQKVGRQTGIGSFQ